MKTKNSYLTGCLALLIALSSCTKMNDTQEKYLDWGEKIYAAKIDSVFALSGYQRQVIDIYYSAPRIDHGIIVYNLNQDTVVFELPEAVIFLFRSTIWKKPNTIIRSTLSTKMATNLCRQKPAVKCTDVFTVITWSETRSTKSLLWTVSPSIPKEQPKPKASMLLIPT